MKHSLVVKDLSYMKKGLSADAYNFYKLLAEQVVLQKAKRVDGLFTINWTELNLNDLNPAYFYKVLDEECLGSVLEYDNGTGEASSSLFAYISVDYETLQIQWDYGVEVIKRLYATRSVKELAI